MRNTTTVFAAMTAAALLAGCDTAPPEPGAGTASVDAAAPKPTQAVTRHKLGTSVPTPDGVVDVTALAYRQPVGRRAPEPEQAGYEWAAADVRVCVRKDPGEPIVLGNRPWTLVNADGSAAAPSNITFQQFPPPEYPSGADGDPPTPVGRCKRGWVTFPVPKTARPDVVTYRAAGQPAPIEWRIP